MRKMRFTERKQVARALVLKEGTSEFWPGHCFTVWDCLLHCRMCSHPGLPPIERQELWLVIVTTNPTSNHIFKWVLKELNAPCPIESHWHMAGVRVRLHFGKPWSRGSNLVSRWQLQCPFYAITVSGHQMCSGRTRVGWSSSNSYHHVKESTVKQLGRRIGLSPRNWANDQLVTEIILPLPWKVGLFFNTNYRNLHQRANGGRGASYNTRIRSKLSHVSVSF